VKITADDRPVALYVMVFLNGKLCQRRIFSADEEAGTLMVYAENEKGHLYKQVGTNEPQMETLDGKVEILLKPNVTPGVRRLYDGMRTYGNGGQSG